MCHIILFENCVYVSIQIHEKERKKKQNQHQLHKFVDILCTRKGKKHKQGSVRFKQSNKHKGISFVWILDCTYVYMSILIIQHKSTGEKYVYIVYKKKQKIMISLKKFLFAYQITLWNTNDHRLSMEVHWLLVFYLQH